MLLKVPDDAVSGTPNIFKRVNKNNRIARNLNRDGILQENIIVGRRR
jgi:hypothetical protein